MKNNEVNVFLFIACIIIGILISMNMSFNKNAIRVVLSTKQYQDASYEKLQLESQINSLIDELKTMNSKVQTYDSGFNSTKTVTDELNKEIQKNKMDLGYTAVTGEGIRFSVSDASEYLKFSTAEDRNYIVHDYDIMNILNDLKDAGAEAISINGQRIISTSSIFCSEVLIDINGVEFPKPFNFEAIGNKATLLSYMDSDENYLKYLRYVRKIHWDIETVDNLTIPAYNGNIKSDKISEAK